MNVVKEEEESHKNSSIPTRTREFALEFENSLQLGEDDVGGNLHHISHYLPCDKNKKKKKIRACM
jgi:hypothetical protein